MSDEACEVRDGPCGQPWVLAAYATIPSDEIQVGEGFGVRAWGSVHSWEWARTAIPNNLRLVAMLAID